MSTRSDPPQKLKLDPVSVGRLMQTRPLIILGGVWTLVMVVALVALSGLLNPSMSISKGHQPAGVSNARVVRGAQPAKPQSGIPLWLFGAIALSCAGGSVLIAKQAARPPRPRKNAKFKRLKPYASKATAALTPKPQTPSKEYSPLPPIQLQTRIARAVPVSLASSTNLVPSVHPHAQTSIQRSPDVPVTVVPSEESHPLDWGNASLADALDLRKQRSVSSWL